MLRPSPQSLRNLAIALVLAIAIGAAPRLGLAQAPASGDQPPAEALAVLSDKELDELVGPIALYPDELIAVLMPASTFPLDVVRAARFQEQLKKDSTLKPSDQWDPSVLGLLNYPEVIKFMSDDLQWTERFGTAVINQQKDVMDSIQQFRQRTQAAGNLQSNEQQVIVLEKETIIIKSATPEVIYVPSYNPATVIVQQSTPVVYAYSPPYPYYYSPTAVFWTGMFVGAAVSYGIHGHHGWGHGDVNVKRNTTINRGGNTINRGGGSTWKPSTRPAGRPAGTNRPGYGSGADRRSSGAGRSNAGTRSSRPQSGARTSRGSSRSAVGSYNRGTKTQRNSNRGAQSRSRSQRSRPSGGGRSSRGGGGRSRGGRR